MAGGQSAFIFLGDFRWQTWQHSESEVYRELVQAVCVVILAHPKFTLCNLFQADMQKKNDE